VLPPPPESSASKRTRAPEFLTPPDFYRSSIWARLATIFTPYPVHLTLVSAKLFRDVPIRPRRRAVRQFSFSLILHAAALLLLPLIVRYLPFQVIRAASTTSAEQSVIYYHLANPVDRQKPRKLGLRARLCPGSGSLPDQPPPQALPPLIRLCSRFLIRASQTTITKLSFSHSARPT
jgi:hypothetical protein